MNDSTQNPGNDDLAVDYSVFEIAGPILAIVRRETINDPIAPAIALSIPGGEKGSLVPFFSDDDLARRFLERTGNPEFVAWPVSPSAAMVIILEALKNAGHKNAIFDPEPNQPMRCVSIDAMLDTFRKETTN